jgi:chaperonin GroES
MKKRGERREATHERVKQGEYVLIGKYAGTEIKLDGEEYLIVREDEILLG